MRQAIGMIPDPAYTMAVALLVCTGTCPIVPELAFSLSLIAMLLPGGREDSGGAVKSDTPLIVYRFSALMTLLLGYMVTGVVYGPSDIEEFTLTVTLQELHSQVSAGVAGAVHCASKKAESLGTASEKPGHSL